MTVYLVHYYTARAPEEPDFSANKRVFSTEEAAYTYAVEQYLEKILYFDGEWKEEYGHCLLNIDLSNTKSAYHELASLKEKMFASEKRPFYVIEDWEVEEEQDISNSKALLSELIEIWEL